jgi:hypothetical protein
MIIESKKQRRAFQPLPSFLERLANRILFPNLRYVKINEGKKRENTQLCICLHKRKENQKMEKGKKKTEKSYKQKKGKKIEHVRG